MAIARTFIESSDIIGSPSPNVWTANLGATHITPTQRLALLRKLERMAPIRHGAERLERLGPDFVARFTFESFRLEQIDVTQARVVDALRPARQLRRLRSRSLSRIRNHAAILTWIEHQLRRGAPISAQAVVRWYTSISSGLSLGPIQPDIDRRLGQVLLRIEAPHVRLRPALQDLAAVHAHLLSEPPFPSFSGLVARLLLHYQLRRCGLPAVILDVAADASGHRSEAMFVFRIMQLIESRIESR